MENGLSEAERDLGNGLVSVIVVMASPTATPTTEPPQPPLPLHREIGAQDICPRPWGFCDALYAAYVDSVVFVRKRSSTG